MAEERMLPAVSEAYADFIIQYSKNIYGTVDYFSDDHFQIISENFGVLYVPLEEIPGLTVNSYSYNTIPKCYTYMDKESLTSSGITPLQDHPYLQLRGRNTAVAIIDSGIDYTHPAFLAGNRSRILSIWDQTLPAVEGSSVPYGREFSQEEIQRALESENPYEVVPSRDEDGHGTFLAGIAAGSDLPVSNFSGAAPEASIIVVKLKQAKKYLRDFFLIPEGAAAYQENDIMIAMSYAMKKATSVSMPLAACIGLGSSIGSHRGGSPLAQYLDTANRFAQNAFSVAAGNEGNERNHFQGTVESGEAKVAAELRVGEGEPGFVAEFWGSSPRFYSMQIQSPAGEILEVSTARENEKQILSFVFVETRIEASYVPVERESGESLFFFRFFNPAPGIWKFLVGGGYPQETPFHMWLPVSPFLSEETYFLQSSPYYTVTNPGNAEDAITVTAYDYRTGSLYLSASRGYSASGVVKPDLAAPGVDLLGPGLRGNFTARSGTSVAAAHTAGAVALLFEWAIVRQNAPYLNGRSARNYLTKGADRREGLTYPNPDWGYGTLDLYQVFQELL